MNIAFRDFRLLRLAVENVGPFRNGLHEMRFEGDLGLDDAGQSRGSAPANLYMLLAKNAQGKTTVLESIYALMQLNTVTAERVEAAVFFGPEARVQLDSRVTLTIEETTQTVLLSIWFGTHEAIVDWSQSEIDEIAQASSWAKIGYLMPSGALLGARETNELGGIIQEHIRASVGKPPTRLFGLSSDLPCVLFFPANRTIFAPNGQRSVMQPSRWGYQPAYRFESDGPGWQTSVDNLLVWLEWLDDGRLEDLLKYLNDNIFADDTKTIRRPLRENLASFVSTGMGEHALERLSHGERALLQFFVDTLCYMTENTVVLIDEMEIHLHTRWMNRFFQAVKQLLRDVPGLSIVFTTHNRELMRVFDHTTHESGLVKGGFLIEEGLE